MRRGAAEQRRDTPPPRLAGGPLGRWIGEDTVSAGNAGAGQHAVVLADRLLQDVADYRAAIRGWFARVAPGGHLLLAVPHAFLDDRALALPSPRDPARRRLYTPASLMAEVEEALPPNAYRVRFLSDDDAGYDYAAPRAGDADVLLALERIAPPGFALDAAMPGIVAPAPDWSFAPSQTRIEAQVHPQVRRILVLKLDHLGDFIMAMPAMERLRALFPAAEITLVAGAWNVAAAEALGAADRVIPFDAFPRNSSEERPDVRGRVSAFDAAVAGSFDLAIDLRTDTDTRVLLERVRAPVKAGVGTQAQFPWLDIFLPVDFNRNRPESAREYRWDHHRFISQGPAVRSDYRIRVRGDAAERHCAIVWGPYERLRPGRYFFEPFVELTGGEGALLLDVGLDARTVTHLLAPPADRVRLPFTVERADAEFEFRIWTVDGQPVPNFDFFGGRLVREGAGSTLHQSEYSQLLVELLAIRLSRTGVLEALA